MAPSIVGLALLAAAPSGIKLAAPGFATVNVKPELQTFVTDHLSQAIALYGIQVVSASEISAVIGLERQKQLMGCTDTSTNCVAELAGALGADGLLVGNLGVFGGHLQVDVRVISATDARKLAVYSVTVEDQTRLIDALSAAAASLAAQVSKSLQRALPQPHPDVPPAIAPAPAQAQPRPTVYVERNTGAREAGKWIFFGSTATLLTGFVLAGVGYNNNDQPMQDVGASLFLVGCAGIIAGTILYFAGGTEQVPVQASLYPSNSGLGLALTGRW
jgi:hypothetical protein